MPFKKMENIANFLKAIRALGMKEFEMFSTPDLFEEKNLPQVRASASASVSASGPCDDMVMVGVVLCVCAW